MNPACVAVTSALFRERHLTISDLTRRTGLSRGEVQSALVQLVADERVVRSLSWGDGEAIRECWEVNRVARRETAAEAP